MIYSAQKRNLILYLLISTVSFIFLVTIPEAGISVLIFVIIQAAALRLLLPRKSLLFFAPIFILALNSFISANPMWRAANIVVAAAIYAAMSVKITYGISLKDTSLAFFRRLAETIAHAFASFGVPISWGAQAQIQNVPTIRRVLKGVAISVPVLLFLTVVLSSADLIFSRFVENIFNEIFAFINFKTVERVLSGIFVGLYLFGIVYVISNFKNEPEELETEKISRVDDSIVIGIVLGSALIIYTLFVVIQFGYLFASLNNLPYNLNHVNYARRGFFELLFLTFVNISAILVSVWLTKAKVIRLMCIYLCAVTVVLLASSFYRMYLYGEDDGLTRMRFLVLGFLFFELIGLLFTFCYIAKPKFNIVLVYCLIALSYFLLLNLTPIDRIIARDQVNRYFATGRGGVEYSVTLSPDAAPEIARLLSSPNEKTQELARKYFESIEASKGWRQWNLSRIRAVRMY
ncbi:MAG: DUF4173 domain-containing protein [Defluviitaleaceae bacterium]|nr:DUF4173 domain-containing protein [Defluviitaleaceae bacterium]